MKWKSAAPKALGESMWSLVQPARKGSLNFLQSPIARHRLNRDADTTDLKAAKARLTHLRDLAYP
jgi:hypothetical protein